MLLALASPAIARDNGQWADTSPHVRQWFQSLMQPDAPAVSCCGEADAYEADDYTLDGDTIIAVITDERGDTFPNGVTRPHIEPGTKIRVPAGKVKWDAGNPTGHGIIFIGGGSLYCYVAPGGV
jgi:hypothetical protein